MSLLGLLLGARAQGRGPGARVDASRVASPLSAAGHLDAGTAPLVAEGLRAVFWVQLAVALATLAIGVAILLANRRPVSSGTSAPGPGTGGASSAR